MDTTKVVNGLNSCIKGDCNTCPYESYYDYSNNDCTNCEERMMKDAIEVIEELKK